MKTRNLTLKSLLGICLLNLIPAARAANWVQVFEDKKSHMFAEVDVNSIRKGDDGLIYYHVRMDIGDRDEAMDCRKQIVYQLTNVMGPVKDWKSNGWKIVPRSNGAKIADFVCARAKTKKS